MPDDMDHVQAINEEFLADCLAEHKRRNPPNPPLKRGALKAPHFAKGGGGGICIDCGEAIPEKRRQAVPGCRRCIDCQTDFERQKWGR